MNLDKLKSLIRLANNNPNENEANLAARKVCKIIAEENFKLLNGNSHQPQQQNQQQSAPRTWNDVKRSTEPFWRNNWESIFEQVRRQNEEAAKAKQAEEAKKKQPKTKPESYYESVYWDDDLGFEEEPKKDKGLFQKCYKCRDLKWGPKPIDMLGYPIEFTCYDCLKATKGGR